MKTIIIGNKIEQLINCQKILKFFNVDIDVLGVQSIKELEEFWLLNGQNYNSIILDRFYTNVNQILCFAVEVDFYCIAEGFDNVETYDVPEKENVKCKYYFWPLNYNLLADDIKSISNLKSRAGSEMINLGDLVINVYRRTVSNSEKEVFVKNKEFELLVYMARNRGKVLSRMNLLENVWDMNALISTNTVDVHISKLRKLFRVNFNKMDLIKTISCCGYMIP